MNSGPTPPPMPPQPPHGPGGSSGASGPYSGGPQGPYSGGPQDSGPTYSAAPIGSNPAGGASAASGPAGGSVPQPAPAPGYAPGPGGPDQTRGRQQKKKSKLPLFLSLGAVALVLILVLVGFFVVRSVNNNKYGPDTVAEEYLAALESGNMDKANEITKATAPDGASEKLLVQPIVDGSQDKITDTKVVETTRNGDSAKIHTQYSLGGQSYDLVLTATKDGRQGMFFDKWKLEPPVLPTIALEIPPIGGSTINGQEFTPEAGRVEYAVWPGRYDVTTPESKYITSAEGNATVGFADEEAPQAATVKLSVEATDAFDTDVKKLVEDKVKECAKEKKTSVDGCPMVNISWNDDKGKEAADKVNEKTIERTIDKMPSIRTMLSPDGSGGSFYTESDKVGKMTMKAKSKDGKYRWDGTVDFETNGSVKMDGDKLSVDFY
ncbi:hypothetical protein ACH0BO_11525 [Brevibacterium luteolum]|uniref:hypothetical protein n=1 Tax=Brevibacterium luteolum TaxID=199591 RepID=UPI00387A5FF8